MAKSRASLTAKGGWAPVVIERSLDSLEPHGTNPKQHSDQQIRKLAQSLAVHRFVNPILIDRDGVIIAGHGRYAAAKLLGLSTVPTITLDHLSPSQVRAYRIADNRLAEIGTSWSMKLLNLEVEAILELDADFDLAITGFEARDLVLGTDTAHSQDQSKDPDIPPPPARAVTRSGDRWTIGEHMLLCGDATDANAYPRLLGRERAAMVFADPPYNVPIQGHVSGNGRTKHREFVAASGEMTDAEFRQFLTAFMLLCARFSRAGSLHYVCMDWRGLAHLLAAGAVAYDEYKNLCVWTKAQGGMGSLYRSQHELVAIYKKMAPPTSTTSSLGRTAEIDRMSGPTRA